MSLAFYIHDLSPFIIRFGENFGLRWYGFAYVLAFIFGYLLYIHLVRRGYGPLRVEQVPDFITLGALFGVMLGGRLGWILFYGWEEVLENPWRALKLWEGGMASHGGILGLVIFTFIYARRQRVSWPAIGDNLVVVAPIGLFLVRVANFINGELWGRAVPGAAPGGAGPWWAVQFPKELVPGTELFNRALAATQAVNPNVIDPMAASYADGGIRAALGAVLPPRYPSQLIEAFLEGAVLFAILWVIRTRTRAWVGTLTGAFMVGYAGLRIIAEQFREPDAPLTGGLTRGQFLSLFLIGIGLGFFAYAWVRRVPTPRPGEVAVGGGKAGVGR